MRTLYVATVYCRDCDALFSVAGYDKDTVKARTESLMGACPSKPEYQAFADSRCWTGVNAFDESEAQEHGALGIPEENRKELEQDGITVY